MKKSGKKAGKKGNQVEMRFLRDQVRLAPLHGSSFATAYNGIRNYLPATQPYGLNEWLKALGAKELLNLLTNAVTQKLITQAEFDAAVVNGRPRLRNPTVWRVLEAGVADDLPGMASDVLSGALSVVPGGSVLKPFVADAFNQAVSGAWPDWLKTGASGHVKVPAKTVVGEVSPSPPVPVGEYIDSFARSQAVAPGVSSATFDAVNTEVVKAFLCPSAYSAAVGSADFQPTAVLHGSTVFNLTTNSTGATYAAVLFVNTLAGVLAVIKNDTTFSPTTGAQTPASSTVSPQFGAYLNEIAQIRTNFASVSLEPLPSVLNQSGVVQMFPFTVSPTDAWTTDYSMPQATYPSMPYYSSSALKDCNRLRNIRMSFGAEDQFLNADNVSNSTEGVCILVTGAPLTTAVVAVTVSQCCEFVPASPFRRLIKTEIPSVAPATNAFIAALVRRRPNLLTASVEEALQFTSRIPSGLVPYNELSNLLFGFE